MFWRMIPRFVWPSESRAALCNFAGTREAEPRSPRRSLNLEVDAKRSSPQSSVRKLHRREELGRRECCDRPAGRLGTSVDRPFFLRFLFRSICPRAMDSSRHSKAAFCRYRLMRKVKGPRCKDQKTGPGNKVISRPALNIGSHPNRWFTPQLPGLAARKKNLANQLRV